MTLGMSARLKCSHARGGSNPAGAQIARPGVVEQPRSPFSPFCHFLSFFPGAMGFMKMHTETVRRSSYLVLVLIKSQSEFGCFLAEQSDWLKNPIGIRGLPPFSCGGSSHLLKHHGRHRRLLCLHRPRARCRGPPVAFPRARGGRRQGLRR